MYTIRFFIGVLWYADGSNSIKHIHAMYETKIQINVENSNVCVACILSSGSVVCCPHPCTMCHSRRNEAKRRNGAEHKRNVRNTHEHTYAVEQQQQQQKNAAA